MTSRLLMTAMGALMTLGMGTAASAETAMRCAHQLPPQHPVAQIIDTWAAQVETLSGGEIDVQLFPADSLVGANDAILSVAKGDIECAFSVPFVWGKTMPIMGVSLEPFAFSDINIWRNWYGSEAAQFLEGKLREKGLENVAWIFQTRDSAFSSNGKFLAAPEDFKGMKIRGLMPAFNASLEALGASPVSTPGSEVYESLATGVIDGAMAGVDSTVSRKYYEVQDHFSIVPVISVYFHGYTNAKFYAGLSDTAKEALRQAGAEAAATAVKVAEEGEATYPKQLEEKGVSVYRLSDAENAALQEIMYPAFLNAFTAPKEDVEELHGLIDKLRAQ
ncbi:MAG: TRAP transporter substrate-binding protein DctP [Pseudomonadota bacterium]|nr:TRAP transporter substrate-binding protein DctP [Pseudomonadota bacterium]MEE3071192.1 TRAP transporter substrate-binding protein DctP [Pseudomonadota bacterium]